MRKILIAVFGLFLTLVPLNAAACGVGATGTNGESLDDCSEETQVTTTEAEQKEERQRFTISTEAVLEGNIKNSSFFLANDGTDKSIVGGPLFMIGNQISSEGKYEYGFMAGSTATISGEYTRDLFAAANNLTIDENAKIGRDVFVAGNIVKLKNVHIPGDAYIAANKLTFENVTIDGNLNLAGGSLKVTDSSVGGTFNHNDGLKREGELKSRLEETYTIVTQTIDPVIGMLFGLVSKLVWMVLLMVFCKKFFVNLVENINSDISNDMFKAILIGAGAFIGIPILAVILLMTIVGIPVALILLAAYAVLVYTGTIATAVYLNERFFKIKNGTVGATLGLVIISAVGLAPYLGTMLGLVATVLGFSLIIRTVFGKNN